MKKTVTTVELTWENEVSITISRRRVSSNIREEAVKRVDDDSGYDAVIVDQMELCEECEGD